MSDVRALIAAARDAGASDLEVAEGEPPARRRLGRIEILAGNPLTRETLRAFVVERAGEAAWTRLRDDPVGSLDARDDGEANGPLRIHAYRCAAGIAISIRLLAPTVPAFAALDVPERLLELTTLASGLVITHGPTGAGKTTFHAALIKHLGDLPPEAGGGKHIVTICDPAEYLYRPRHSTIRVLEVGRDVDGIESAIEGVLRKNPSVVEIQEARTARAMLGGLASAEAGHLTFMTVHAKSAGGVIERIISSVRPDRQHQVRLVLADVLEATVGLRLVPAADRCRRVPVVEYLRVTPAIRALIRDGKTGHLAAEIAAGGSLGMTTFERSLARRVIDRTITVADARDAAPDREALDRALAAPAARSA